jgi:hypothetical protein
MAATIDWLPSSGQQPIPSVHRPHVGDRYHEYGVGEAREDGQACGEVFCTP